MSQKCFVSVNEAWTATSQDCSRLDNTQCRHNKRWSIIHTNTDDIFPYRLGIFVQSWADDCTLSDLSVTAMTDIVILQMLKFVKHNITGCYYLWLSVLLLYPYLLLKCHLGAPWKVFSLSSSQKISDDPGCWTYWSRPQKFSGASRYLQDAFVASGREKRAPCYPGRVRYGGISVVDHTQ